MREHSGAARNDDPSRHVQYCIEDAGIRNFPEAELKPERKLAGSGPTSLVDRAHRVLEELIVTQQLPPGSLWSEAALSKLTRIGRTPVREAIKRLAAGHLMEIAPRHGVRVSDVNFAEQLLVLEFRCSLEELIAVLAARRANMAERTMLAAMAKDMERAGGIGDVTAYMRSIFAANRFLARIARNSYVAKAIEPLHTLSQRFYFLHHLELNDLKTVGSLHAKVARAIAAADERAAAAAARLMMEYVERFTRELITRHLAQPLDKVRQPATRPRSFPSRNRRVGRR